MAVDRRGALLDVASLRDIAVNKAGERCFARFVRLGNQADRRQPRRQHRIQVGDRLRGIVVYGMTRNGGRHQVLDLHFDGHGKVVRDFAQPNAPTFSIGVNEQNPPTPARVTHDACHFPLPSLFNRTSAFVPA